MGYVPSVAMAPGEPGKLKVTKDKSYMLHGEIMLLVLVMLCALFLSCMVLCLYLRRRRRVQREESDAVELCEVAFKGRDRAGSATYHCP